MPSALLATIASNRISYLFDFHGPSMTIDAACSGSLVAFHAACQSLILHESNLALAGGVNLMLHPDLTLAYTQAQVMSLSGRCHAFGALSDGYVRSEDAGIVVLKRLADALTDEDPIYTVIRAAVSNQDGRTDGITVPNGDAQEVAIKAALTQGGVRPEEVQYVEAHGTGTLVGDPIEVNALGRSLRGNPEDSPPLIVGSVKANVGHLESASGIVGLIKTTLSLKHRRIPAHLLFGALNPDIPFSKLNVRVPLEDEDWPENRDGARRLVGVNSFGFGGTNVHVLLEEPPPKQSMPQGKEKRESSHKKH